MKKYYLAYGSNLNIEQMTYRCPSARPIGTASLDNYCLVFKGSKTGSYLTIEPKQGSYVPLAVWEVERDDEHSLDRYEGYPTFYYKRELSLEVKEFEGIAKKITAFIYIMNEYRKYSLPHNTYLQTCLDGYIDFGFDSKIIDKALQETERRISNEKCKN